MLVPSSCRLAKKLGDLLQLLFFMLDWQPSTLPSHPTTPSSHLSGASAPAAPPSGQVPPIADAEVSVTDDCAWVLAGLEPVPGRSVTCGDVTAQSFAAHMQAVLEAFVQGLVFEGCEASAAFEDVLLNDEGRQTLRQMRLCIAALHIYFEALASKPGTLEVGDSHARINSRFPRTQPQPSHPGPTRVHAGTDCRPVSPRLIISTSTSTSQVHSLRERLSAAIAHGPRTAASGRPSSTPSPNSSASPNPSSVPSRLGSSATTGSAPASTPSGGGACGWLEAHLARMRACGLDLDLLHALCRADVVEQASRSASHLATSPSRSELRAQRHSRERATVRGRASSSPAVSHSSAPPAQPPTTPRLGPSTPPAPPSLAESKSSESRVVPTAAMPTLCAPCADADADASGLASAAELDLTSSSRVAPPAEPTASKHPSLPGMGEAIMLPMRRLSDAGGRPRLGSAASACASVGSADSSGEMPSAEAALVDMMAGSDDGYVSLIDVDGGPPQPLDSRSPTPTTPSTNAELLLPPLSGLPTAPRTSATPKLHLQTMLSESIIEGHF